MTRSSSITIALVLVVAACSESPVGIVSPPDIAPAYGVGPGQYVDLGHTHHASASPFGVEATVASGVVVNGSFEENGGASSTTLNGWTTFNQGSGAVFAQTGTRAPLTGLLVSAPPHGAFAAMTSQGGPGRHIWYQDIVVPSARSELHFDLFILNRARVFVTAPHLLHNAGQNQQFRADLMDPGAAVDDVGAGVLANIYQTQPGDPLESGYNHIVFDLSAFAGQTVRLRFAEVDNLLNFHAGVDNVFIDILDPTTKAECMEGGWEAFGFTNQGQCIRFVETGKDSR